MKINKLISKQTKILQNTNIESSHRHFHNINIVINIQHPSQIIQHPNNPPGFLSGIAQYFDIHIT